MKERQITLPIIALIAGTRMAVGVGVGLLLASRLTRQQRMGAGWALIAVGGLTTIPLLAHVLGQSEPSDDDHARGQQHALNPYEVSI